MVLDHAGVQPNPARDRVLVKLPREEIEEPNPPIAEHLRTVYRRLPEKHRLAFLFLDWSGARVSAIDHVLVGDYDEPRPAWRAVGTNRRAGRPAQPGGDGEHVHTRADRRTELDYAALLAS